MTPSECWVDCCEYCIRVDPSPTKEIDPCIEMTKRCKGDSCSTCRPCKTFAPGTDFQDAMAQLRSRHTRFTVLKIRQQPTMSQRRLT